MKVKDIIKELSQINPNYDVTVNVGNNEEQDIVIKISKVLCLKSNTAIGFVQLKTANDLDWSRKTQEGEIKNESYNNNH